MDDALQVVSEMNQCMWSLLKEAVDDLSNDEINWRPLPQSNNINIIVRHLRIEAQWHLNSLKRGEAMPSDVTPALQEEIDAVPLDFQRNLAKPLPGDSRRAGTVFSQDVMLSVESDLTGEPLYSFRSGGHRR